MPRILANAAILIVTDVTANQNISFLFLVLALFFFLSVVSLVPPALRLRVVLADLRAADVEEGRVGPRATQAEDDHEHQALIKDSGG